MLTEKVELLGKGLYTNAEIPDSLTLKSIPTATELDYVGSEDFDKTMLEKILPKSVEEKINFGELLVIDYYWICRTLRMLSYGYYYTTNSIFCADCGQVSYGEHRVDLRTIAAKPVPEGFINDVVISSEDFLDFKKDIHIAILTINENLQKQNDGMFKDRDGKINRNLATVCYSVKQIGDKKVLPLDVKNIIEKQMTAADYELLKGYVHDKLNYGLSSGGRCICPKCGSNNGAFMAMIDDRFFRPTMGDLKQWGRDRSDGRSKKDVLRSKAEVV